MNCMVSRNSVLFRCSLAGVGWLLSLSVTWPSQFKLLLMLPRFPCTIKSLIEVNCNRMISPLLSRSNHRWIGGSLGSSDYTIL
jgi:hypothetical protein